MAGALAGFAGMPNPYDNLGSALSNKSGTSYNPNTLQWSAPPTPNAAPAGYTFDTVQGKYVPTATSAASAAAQQKALFDQEQANFQAQTASRQQLQSALGGLVGQMGSIGSSSSTQPFSFNPAQYPIQPAQQAHVQYQSPDTSGAQAAIFGAAKDQVGQTSGAALRALRSQLAGRGMLGSGQESQGTERLITSGAQQLGDVTRQNAISALGQAQNAAEQNFQGGITQRAQDISAGQADAARAQQFGLTEQDLAARQQMQNAQIQQSNLSNILSALKGLY